MAWHHGEATAVLQARLAALRQERLNLTRSGDWAPEDVHRIESQVTAIRAELAARGEKEAT